MDVKLDLNNMTSAEIQAHAKEVGAQVGEIINKAILESNELLRHLKATIKVSYDLVPLQKDQQ